MNKENDVKKELLVLGIGNLLMGDEGVGIHVVNHLNENYDLGEVDILDGGTGGFHLLEYFQKYHQVLIIDATIDGQPAGTISYLKPKFSSDYPPTLTAHDIGLKDLIDSLFLLNVKTEIFLLTISIPKIDKVSLEISDQIQKAVPVAAEKISKLVKSNLAESFEKELG
jgi:hydrogenase maturation protease